MSNKTHMITLAARGWAVLFAIALTHLSMTAQKAAPVIVSNTEASPVPVKGGVTITNAPTVDARQSGDWNVGITGTPTVKLDPSTPAIVSNANEPARQWVSFNLITNERIYTPPPGKTLVLEYVSGTITLGNNFGFPILSCSSIGTLLPKMSRPSGSTETTWYFSELVRGYADRDNSVSCDTNFAVVTSFIFRFKGHFVDGVREQP